MLLARRHRLALELGLLVLVAWVAALAVTSALRVAVDDVPPALAAAEAPAVATPTPGPLADYAVIATRDVFNPAPAASGASGRHGTLRLWGVGLQGSDARAVIEDTTTHRQELYRVGDDIGGRRIVAIDWDRVTLAYAGGEDVLELSPSASEPAEPVEEPPAVAEAPDGRIRRTGENAFVVDRRELTGAVGNMSGLMTQLRAVAEVQDGRPAGFRLFRMQDDSIFRRLGLQNGDVVQRVNGQAVSDPANLLAFLQRLRTEPRVALDIRRGAERRTMVYDLR